MAFRGVYGDLMHVTHEPIHTAYRSDEFFRDYEGAERMLGIDRVRVHLERVAALKEDKIYLEAGWPAYGAVPLFRRTFDEEFGLIHLTRHPVRSALSLMTTVYGWREEGWSEDDWRDLTLPDPRSARVALPEYAERWASLTPYEQCLLWWTELQLYAKELEERYPTTPFLRLRSEDLFSSDPSALKELVSFLGLPFRESLLEWREYRIDNYGARTTTSAWRQIFDHPPTISVAKELGYDVGDVDESFLKGRFAVTTPLPREVPQTTFDDALATHRAQVDEVLATGDEVAIKKLYVELGDLLEDAAQNGEEIPVLSFPETAAVVVDLLSGVGGLLLDAGCGPNPALTILLGRRPDRKVVALDIGLGTVRLARAQARKEGVDIHAVVADVEALPFREDVFDISVCEDTIEHLPSDAAGVAELSRVLKPTGRLVMGTPNRWRLDVLRRRIADRRAGRRLPDEAYYAATSHLREYTWGSLERVVGTSFDILQRATVGWSETPRGRLSTRFVKRWPFIWVGRMLILLAQPRRKR